MTPADQLELFFVDGEPHSFGQVGSDGCWYWLFIVCGMEVGVL